MPDTIQRAVCPECGGVSPPRFEGSDCMHCFGTVGEAQTFVSEAALRELASGWRQDADEVVERLDLPDMEMTGETCAKDLESILDGGDE